MFNKELSKKELAHIRDLNRNFCSELPQEARKGQYTPVVGDRFFKERYAVRPGRYRVIGSEWIITIDAGRIVDIIRAVPPDYGGANVVSVPNASG